jgi:hypothetical protein
MLFLLCCNVYPGLAQITTNSVYAETGFYQVNITKYFDTVATVFKSSHKEGLFIPFKERRYNPTLQDVATAESLFQRAVSLTLGSLGDPKRVVLGALRKSYRQYMGVVDSNNHRLVFLNVIDHHISHDQIEQDYTREIIAGLIYEETWQNYFLIDIDTCEFVDNFGSLFALCDEYLQYWRH